MRYTWKKYTGLNIMIIDNKMFSNENVNDLKQVIREILKEIESSLDPEKLILCYQDLVGNAIAILLILTRKEYRVKNTISH